MALVDLFAEEHATRLEANDRVRSLRSEFAVPPAPGGAHEEAAYFAGNSLGLMPLGARASVVAELDEWARLGVEAWFEGREPWLESAGTLRAPLARMAGASEPEIAVVHSLTVNLHLLLASFYRPTETRYAVLTEADAFPSDSHAVQTHVSLRGLSAAHAVLRCEPEDLALAIDRRGDSIALVLLGGLGYLSGELLEMREITAAAQDAGALVGWDLAHVIGNVPVQLHEWGVDFAAWCNYKYVNAGPGAPAGIYVHEQHGSDPTVPRLAGWWGTDPTARFRMEPDFVPRAGAQGWAVSTPPILAHAPLRASLELFDRVGLPALRERSIRLTGYLEQLLDEVALGKRLELITPRDPTRRGAQLSVAVVGAKALTEKLRIRHGVVCDFREPDVLRFAPAPLYNTFEDCRRAALALVDVLPDR